MFAALLAASAAAQEPPIRFAAPIDPDNSTFLFIKSYMQALCAEAGLSCVLFSMPSPRIVVEMGHDQIDVDMVRVSDFIEQKGLQDLYRRLDIPVISLGFVIYTNARSPAIDSWRQLGDQAHRIGFLRGALFAEQRLRELGGGNEWVPVTNFSYCASMLAADRVDACIAAEGLLSQDARKLIESGKIHCGKVVEERAFFAHVNRHRPSLYPKLMAAQQALHASGADRRLQGLLNTD